MSSFLEIVSQVLNPTTGKTLGEESRVLKVDEKGSDYYIEYNRDGITPEVKKEIEEQILSGIVENQTFYIDETIFIEIDNLVIRNCTFIASKPLNPMIYAGKVSGLTIEYCKFNNQSSKDSQAIMFENTSSKIPTVDFKPTALTGKKINLPHGAGITGYKS